MRAQEADPTGRALTRPVRTLYRTATNSSAGPIRRSTAAAGLGLGAGAATIGAGIGTSDLITHANPAFAVVGGAVSAVGTPTALAASSALALAGLLTAGCHYDEKTLRRDPQDSSAWAPARTSRFFRNIGVATIATGGVVAAGLGLSDLAIGAQAGLTHALTTTTEIIGVTAAVALGTGQYWNGRAKRFAQDSGLQG